MKKKNGGNGETASGNEAPRMGGKAAPLFSLTSLVFFAYFAKALVIEMVIQGLGLQTLAIKKRHTM